MTATTMSSKRGVLIVVVGPTGSGKSALAVELAKHLRAPIISTDSRQVFRGMPIGTAQPTAEELEAENKKREEEASKKSNNNNNKKDSNKNTNKGTSDKDNRFDPTKGNRPSNNTIRPSDSRPSTTPNSVTPNPNNGRPTQTPPSIKGQKPTDSKLNVAPANSLKNNALVNTEPSTTSNVKMERATSTEERPNGALNTLKKK